MENPYTLDYQIKEKSSDHLDYYFQQKLNLENSNDTKDIE